MKTVKKTVKAFRQGDVPMFRRAELPADAVPRKDAILAHSETGHHHVAEGARVYGHPTDHGIGYLVFGELLQRERANPDLQRLLQMPRAKVVHTRNDGHEHETLEIEPTGKTTVIEFHRQVQFRPEGLTFVVD
jgi:hypothetical protein